MRTCSACAHSRRHIFNHSHCEMSRDSHHHVKRCCYLTCNAIHVTWVVDAMPFWCTWYPGRNSVKARRSPLYMTWVDTDIFFMLHIISFCLSKTTLFVFLLICRWCSLKGVLSYESLLLSSSHYVAAHFDYDKYPQVFKRLRKWARSIDTEMVGHHITSVSAILRLHLANSQLCITVTGWA